MTVVTLDRHDRTYRIHDPGGRLGAAYATGRPYEWQLLDEIAGRRLTGSALDVGAHVGNHTLFLAAVCDLHVVAIEPDARAHAMLLDNLALNPGLDVETFHVAAGRQRTHGRLTSLMRVEPDDDGPVCVMPIDDLVDLDDLVLVKVDVEGYEAEVLAGAARHLRRCHPLVYAECHTRTAGQRLGAVLRPLGYEITGTLQMGSPMTRWQYQ